MDRITGGRFDLLIRYANMRSDVESKVAELERDVRDKLLTVDVAHSHDFFGKLITSGTHGVTSDARVETGLPESKLAALLEANIVAAHPGKRYTFHSRYVERYFQKASARPPHGT